MKELKCSVGVPMTKDNWIKAFEALFGTRKSVINSPHSSPIAAITSLNIYDSLIAFISQVENDAIDKTNKKWASTIHEVVYWSHRKRCLLYGCIYGIPGVDKKPKDRCDFCGEPRLEDNSFWEKPISDLIKGE